MLWIQQMEKDIDLAGSAMDKIKVLTRNYDGREEIARRK
jgi:hypothetical protein